MKINIVKKHRARGYTYNLLLFFVCNIEAMANKQKGGPQWSSKITNKAPVSFMFWEPLIIIDDQWLPKYEGQRRFIR